MTYEQFLTGKLPAATDQGFEVAPEDLPALLFGWQRDIVRWACKRGRAALFLDCGYGKTAQQLAWAQQVCRHTGGNVLILAPLAVAAQTRREGEKFSVPVTVCRTQADVRPGINVTNYEMLAHFEPRSFAGVVLDESGILKSYMGSTKRTLVNAFAQTSYRLCCTATPAPNDHMELGNHSEFLGIMPAPEMLSRWFINDTQNMGVYRLKGHARRDFWRWIASWAVSMRRPSDLGYADDGFILPPLHVEQVTVPVDLAEQRGDHLFRMPKLNSTDMHRELRLTAPARARKAAELVNGNDQAWIVWCHTNYEADAIVPLIPEAIEVRGSKSVAEKEGKLDRFSRGDARVIITKPTIAGWGLHWAHCHNVVFAGVDYSMESAYQAIRRSYRFGQKEQVNVYLTVAETEGQIVDTLHRKFAAHEEMQSEMAEAMKEWALGQDRQIRIHSGVKTHETETGTLYHGDCVDVVKAMEDNGIHFSIFSPPFSSLYIYSDALQDMGNSADDDEFFRHFDYLIPEIYRVTVPGRLCAVHCKQLVNYKGRDGMAGLRDFRGEIIRHFRAHGWAYHSEVCIWTDPVGEMQRTKAHGLLYKQLRADASFSRQGLPEYLVVFRKWAHGETEQEQVQRVTHTKDDLPLEVWQRYASPVWFDIRRTDVLNADLAREEADSKHICPLQLGVIERALELWTNAGDVVFDPFVGVGSTAAVAARMGRGYVGVELKESYALAALRFIREAEAARHQPTLFDGLDEDEMSSGGSATGAAR